MNANEGRRKMIKLVFSGGKVCDDERVCSASSLLEVMDEWEHRRETSDGTLKCQFIQGDGCWGELWETSLYGGEEVIDGWFQQEKFMEFLLYFIEGCYNVQVFGGDGYALTPSRPVRFRCTEVPRSVRTVDDIEEARLLRKVGYTK